MFMYDNDSEYVIVFAPFEKVVDVLLAHKCDGAPEALTKVLKAMESVSTDDSELMQAVQRTAMHARQEWFTLHWCPEYNGYCGECLTPDITGPRHELRDIFEGVKPENLLDKLIDGYGLPEDRERLRAQR